MESPPTGLELNAIKRSWREFCEAVPDSPDRQHIGLISSFTVEPLIPYLGEHLRSFGIPTRISAAPYNQVHQSCLAPAQSFDAPEPAVYCVLWRIEELLHTELIGWCHGDAAALDNAGTLLEALGGVIRSLATSTGAPVIVSNPPYPADPRFAPSDLDAPETVGRFHTRILADWTSIITRIDGVHLFDLDGIQRDFGLAASKDDRKWHLYRQPYTELFLHTAAHRLARHIRALSAPPKKCIALDCDNTLWGGVIGEDGLSGIEIGAEFPGKAFQDLQRRLLHWKQQGVMLALLSKNNEGDVWDVFDTHDGMVLQRSDIAAWRVNWDPKPANITEIAAELNIGLDSFVFIDDNGFEIDQMRTAHPDTVECFQLPEDPAQILGELNRHAWFDRNSVSEEDRRRTEMIVSERERAPLQESLSLEDFVKTLELKIEFFEAADEHIGRIAQLINKTNQFNLTTIRRTEEEVRALVDSNAHRVFGAHIQDRFGDYGLTGVVILDVSGPAWHIDTFLLSCRVLGRGVETAILAQLASLAAEPGVTTITAAFIPTAKNAPAANFLPGHGFTETGDRFSAETEALQTLHVSVDIHFVS